MWWFINVCPFILWENSDPFVDKKAMVLATDCDVFFPLVQVALRNSHVIRKVLRLSIWSQIRVLGPGLLVQKTKTPIRNVDTKVVADVARVVAAESVVFVAGRLLTSLLIVGRRLGTRVARARPSLLMLRNRRRKRRNNWSSRTPHHHMDVPLSVCAIWQTLLCICALVVCKACSQSVEGSFEYWMY